MGYEVSLFRGADRSRPAELPVESWARFVQDEGLDQIDQLSVTSPSGDRISIPGPFLRWSGHSSGEPVVMRVEDGPSIVVKNPDDETIRWLIAAAVRLGGRVQGDEGEYYDESWPGRLDRPTPDRPA